jgi:hypothetical protein
MKLSENPVSKDVQALYSGANTTVVAQASPSNSTAAPAEASTTTLAFADSKNVTSDIASAISNLQ